MAFYHCTNNIIDTGLKHSRNMVYNEHVLMNKVLCSTLVPRQGSYVPCGLQERGIA